MTYKIGDIITFKIAVSNEGNVAISDILLNDNLSVPDILNPNDTYDELYITHKVTQQDINNGSFTQIGKIVECEFQNRNEFLLKDFCVDGKCKITDFQQIIPNIILSIEEISSPATNGKYKLNENVKLRVNVKNGGNVSFDSIDVNNDNTISSLDPNITKSYNFTHKITVQDMINHSYAYSATVTDREFTEEIVWNDVFWNTANYSVTSDRIENYNPYITLEITEISTPSNGTNYFVGDEIQFQITATNTGNIPITNILLNDNKNIASLNPGASYSYNTQKYTVTQAIINNKPFTKSISVSNCEFEGRNTFTNVSQFSNTASKSINNFQSVSPHIALSIREYSSPANNQKYVLDETVKFEVTAENTGNVSFNYAIFNESNRINNLLTTGANKKQTYIINHVITLQDMINGYFSYTASLSNYEIADNIQWSGNFCNDATLRINTIASVNPHLSGVISNISTPANGINYEVGENVTYTVTLTNDGNITLIDLSSSTININSGTSIKPNKNLTISNCIYKLTQNDIDNGEFKIAVDVQANTNCPTNPTLSNTYYSDTIKILQIFSYTVDTRKYSTAGTSKKTSIPFNLYGINNATIKVDWGDNTTSTFTKSNYSSNTALNNTASTALIHTYSTAGVYTITVASSDFKKIKIYNSSSNTAGSPINYYKKTLTSINKAFPKLNITNFDYCFNECISLTTVPTDLFRYNTTVSSFNYCFRGCSSLTTLPANIFRYNTVANDFEYCFENCTSFNSIPTTLFKYNTAITDFEGCFKNCTSIATIPATLFEFNTSVTKFNQCFSNCTLLSAIPATLFNPNRQVINFEKCFYGCSKLTTVPTGLFDNNTAVTVFSSCFENCTKITSIPATLFNKNTVASNFSGCFRSCTSLRSIPSGLFSTNIKASNFLNCFRKCTSVTTIPTGLFDNCTDANSFGNCFFDCSGITAIPANLFKNNINAINFGATFTYCTSITIIPVDLFRYNTKVTNFAGVFEGCTGISSIPTDIFRYNTKVNTFNGCFQSCDSLTSIPTNIFKYNTVATKFNLAFCACFNIDNFTIHIGSPNVIDADDFVSEKTGRTRTIYVPNSSTTKITFNGVATSLGLTILGE